MKKLKSIIIYSMLSTFALNSFFPSIVSAKETTEQFISSNIDKINNESSSSYIDEEGKKIETIYKTVNDAIIGERYVDGVLVYTSTLSVSENGDKIITEVDKENNITQTYNVDDVVLYSDMGTTSIDNGQPNNSLISKNSIMPLSNTSYANYDWNAVKSYYYNLTGTTYTYQKTAHYKSDLVSNPQSVDIYMNTYKTNGVIYTVNAHRMTIMSLASLVLSFYGMPTSLATVVQRFIKNSLVVAGVEIIDEKILEYISPSFAADLKEFNGVAKGRRTGYVGYIGGTTYTINSDVAGKYSNQSFYDGVTLDNFDPIRNITHRMSIINAAF